MRRPRWRGGVAAGTPTPLSAAALVAWLCDGLMAEAVRSGNVYEYRTEPVYRK